MPVDEKKASIYDYEVNPRYIGKGGFATVYRATHKDTGIEYAIKKINKKSLAGKENLLRRIQEEVKIHFQLKHKSICELYDVFEDQLSICLVLRLCEKGEFMTYLKKVGPLSENDTRFYMNQIVDGLWYLHKHNIIHRDLTLSNLLLTKEGNVMIADFGLATQITESSPCHTTFCGTPNYLSPEVASGLPHGLSTDVWSLGVMMYTMLTGNPPFAQNSGPNETIEKVREGKWSMPPGLSYFAQDLLSKLLQKDPRQRISLEQVREHPFMTRPTHNDAANSITASSGGGGSASFSRQTSNPQQQVSAAAAATAASAMHHLSASSGSHHTPRMPIIQTSASTPYTPNLSTSSSSLKMTATTASGSFNDEGNDSGLANSTASTSVSHHHMRSLTSGNTTTTNNNLATLNSGLEQPNNFYQHHNQYSSSGSGSSNTSSHEHHHQQQQQQHHHNAYNNSNGNNLPLSSVSSSSFRHAQQTHHYPSQPFEHLKSGGGGGGSSSSSSDNNNLSSSLSSPHSSSSSAPSPPLSAFTNLAIQPNAQQSQNAHQLYQQSQHHSQHSYTNQYPANVDNNISYDNNTSSSSNRQHSQSDRVKQRTAGPGSQVAQSPPVKLSSYPTRDMSVNNRDNSTTPYTNMPQYQQQQQQINQMRPLSSLSQTNPNQAAATYSYNQQQQEYVQPPPPPSQTRGQLTSSMSMDDLTTNSRHFSPCPSPMPTSSYAMHRSDSTSHLSSISGCVTNQPQQQQQPQPHKSHDHQSASKKPVRYEHGHTPLKFTRQVLKNTLCYTAVSNVECQIEALKESKSKSTVTVKEVLRLRFDQDLIWVYKCKSPMPFNVDVMAPCPDTVPCYTLDALPPEYWAKYTNACKFMTLIRNKTPKITYYSDQAKALLFDTPGMFEVRFYSNSCKIIYSNTFITIVKDSGEEFKLTGLHSIHITEDMKPLLDQSEDMYKLCKAIESVSEIERTKKKVFPIVLGEKPRKQQQQQQQQQIQPPAPLTKQPSQPISSSHPNLSHTQQQQLQQTKHQQPQTHHHQQQYINHQEYHMAALASMSTGGNELRSASAYSMASSTLSSSAAPYKPNAQHQQYIANNHHQPNNHIYPPQQQQLFSSNQQLYQQQYQQQNRSASYQRQNHLSNC